MLSKDEIRKSILRARELEPGRDAKSLIVQGQLLLLPSFAEACTILSYVGVGTEVATDVIVEEALRLGKRVGAPYVTKEGLKSAFIHSRADLVPARFGLLEPAEEIRQEITRASDVSEVDLFVVPGVAFDRRGGRLGHGRAYYDRLLMQARSDAQFIAVAFECQLVSAVPMTATDIFMHAVITERDIYRP